MDEGLLYALSAYLIWGLFPIYWKLLKTVPATQLIGHRILWSFILLTLVLIATRRWADFRQVSRSARTLRTYFLAALLVGTNWYIYVWAVNAGFILETSLGYFINPLLSVLLGVFFFRERLRQFQWVALGLAALGVVYLTVEYGRPPWIALGLAVSFAFYGLVKKNAPLSGLYGVALETGLLFIPALLFLGYQEWLGVGAFGHSSALLNLLMVGAGLVTTVPLILFGSAAQRIPLSTIGVLQYITPSIQFLIGLFIFKENFNTIQAIGFGIVWAGLILFWVEGWFARRAATLPEPQPEMGEG
jgi:chloramphenicol-sensitive protein RarD